MTYENMEERVGSREEAEEDAEGAWHGEVLSCLAWRRGLVALNMAARVWRLEP